METFLGIIFLVLIIMYPKPFFKFVGFFMLGFMVGLKGINPLKWGDD